MCDCKPAMMAIEAAWRRVGKAGVPEVEGLRTWDRGAMLEAICAIRARLGRVVFMWVPAHEGDAQLVRGRGGERRTCRHGWWRRM